MYECLECKGKKYAGPLIQMGGYKSVQQKCLTCNGTGEVSEEQYKKECEDARRYARLAISESYAQPDRRD